MKIMSKSGFTLVELLMVIAIIGIISMLAIQKLSGLQSDAKEKMNLANLERVSNGLETYIAANADKDRVNLDKLDSLTLWNNHAAGSPGDTSQLASKDQLLFYTNQAGNVGLSTELFGNSNPYASSSATLLGQYFLSASDVSVLEHDLGIHYLYEGTDGTMNRVGDDGAWAQGEIGDPDKCSSVAVSNYPGRVVAVVNPGGTAGRSPVGPDVYKSVGENVTYGYDGKIRVNEEIMADNKAAFEKLMTGDGILMAFGLGDNCVLIGSNKAGFDSAPVSPAMRSDEYRRYMILVRVKYTQRGSSFTAQKAEYAGVMDPRGKVISTLR
ncbi:MAG: type II secretion system protein [Kiritimatiellae bacterium]|nr:type II secretion system protein [Kiritimatiellia bacterium]